MKLQIETEANKWITVFSDDFENNNNNWEEGINRNGSGKNSFFIAAIQCGSAAQGKGCFVIEGKNIINYGSNNKAGKFADVNGIKLYYEIYGEGMPLIILHGNGGSIANASAFYPDLIKKYKVIAIDIRSLGRSTDTGEELTYDQMASDVNALLEQLKIDSVFIWRQSDGAILGLLLAKIIRKKLSVY